MRTRFAFLKITILILSSIFTSQLAYGEMQVLFPVSNDVKAVSDMHVIGRSDSGEPAIVSVNGRETKKKLISAADADGKPYYMLMTILKLDAGENIIKVTQNGKTSTYRMTKVDSPVSITDWTESFTGFHQSERTKVCENCHGFQQLNDCVNCHRDKFIGEWVHAPVKEAKCFTCHEQERSFVPKEPFAETCLDCHEDMNKKLTESEYSHGPVAAGFCTICHSPHKSTDKTHLRKPAGDLCADCHVSDDQGFSFHSDSYIKFHPVEGVYSDKLDKNIECNDCHNPHYADNSMMLKENGEKLCMKCHEEADTKALLSTLMEKYGAQ